MRQPRSGGSRKQLGAPLSEPGKLNKHRQAWTPAHLCAQHGCSQPHGEETGDDRRVASVLRPGQPCSAASRQRGAGGEGEVWGPPQEEGAALGASEGE